MRILSKGFDISFQEVRGLLWKMMLSRNFANN
jgi:hypothetical protein